MIKKRDKLKPIQPYFVLDTLNFRQEIYLRQGISHFYTFRCREDNGLRTVPDGCMDLFFAYTERGMQCFVRGTVTEFRKQELSGIREIFGVRFMPGIQPALVNVQMKDMLDKHLEMKQVLSGDDHWLSEMEKEMDFYQRIRIFLWAYSKAEKMAELPYGKKAIAMTIKQLIYESDGKIKIADTAAQTGYSERYVHKVFKEEMGFSPKEFCKIIQFQRILDYLNYGEPDKLAEAAVEFGYYDQPQLIRDFKKFAGVTPKKYINIIRSSGYSDRILSNEVPKE